MLQITEDFKQKVLTALNDARLNYGGTDTAFSKKFNINNAVYSRLKKGETDGLLKETQWLSIGRELGVNLLERKWNIARTEVFTTIEEDILFCQEYAKGKMCVDDCGIGKTFTAKYLSRTLKNCFYVDASQAKGVHLFIKAIARAVGVDTAGKYADIKANVKYYLNNLPKPIVIIDEAGDLNTPVLLEIKELW
ncbi:MAG TPA: ATP-binding protein, partial [Mucilaginibacter sp.]